MMKLFARLSNAIFDVDKIRDMAHKNTFCISHVMKLN